MDHSSLEYDSLIFDMGKKAREGKGSHGYQEGSLHIVLVPFATCFLSDKIMKWVVWSLHFWRFGFGLVLNDVVWVGWWKDSFFAVSNPFLTYQD